MYSTTYHRAASVADAAKLVSLGDAKLLAGGMTLIPAMKTRLAAPSDLVDIGRIAALKGVKVSGATVTIGAGSTHAEVAADAGLKAACPALSRLAGMIGDPHVRNMGTIGGSIANNDPAADYPAALLALAATIVTDRREIAADDFFTGQFETALEEGEIITAVRFTAPAKAAYEKFRNPASRYAIVGVFVAKGDSGVRAAVTGAGDDGVFRSSEIEAALANNFDPSALDGLSVPADSLMTDIHASAEYRANLIVVMAKRAVARANG
ncbi:FAD binding domain-containing protein [Allomesorhizobium camelthorni]|uniref:Xanthine dehydrogenase family protein subunit M n=1 Tax=Allomesorhizobium camelthorni TaxID=475069 RepID=A0A6G4W688_9HYPH|nr:xanthine dehydrogenase family protein subunit M [Mesorhizobium camelthorni]NGO50252.1 xanthine dehydrogenase family protein subunit M [Mesorhizobium camelthorni]